LVSITVYGDLHVDKPEYEGIFHFNSLFVSASVRNAVNQGLADYVPIFLSEIPELFKQNILPLDVALIQVSPPDEHGYCSMGVSVDIARSAVNNAKHIIASINPNVPRTHGDGLIHSSRFDSMVYCKNHCMKWFSTKAADSRSELCCELIEADTNSNGFNANMIKCLYYRSVCIRIMIYLSV
jgi:acyl-CoA hydrolase